MVSPWHEPATVNRKLASISTFCEWARKHAVIEANPTEGIGNVQQVELARRWLTRKEQYAVLRAVRYRRRVTAAMRQ